MRSGWSGRDHLSHQPGVPVAMRDVRSLASHADGEHVPPGAIPAQIAYALSRMLEARQIKLYNSGSFFDPHAIPPADDAVVAEQVNGFERVIVESHPALIGARCFALQRLLQGQLEVAMGLETAHPGVLEKLNKRMTLDQYATAASSLRGGGIDLRSFVLLQPPFMIAEEALEWACRSIDFAFDCGATAITLIPTRSGNGSVDDLARAGLFTAPQLSLLEDALAYGVRLRQGRVFVDLWDIGRVRSCAHCRAERVERLRIANLQQQIGERVDCVQCGGRG